MDWLDNYHRPPLPSWELRPYQHVLVTDPVYRWKSVGEIISHPYRGEVMVRRIPGDPCTMEELPISDLSPVHPVRWVHYIELTWHESARFPIEEMSGDCAQPANFYLDILDKNYGPQVIMKDDSKKPVIAVTSTNYYNGMQVWSPNVWAHKGWSGKIIFRNHLEHPQKPFPLTYRPWID